MQACKNRGWHARPACLCSPLLAGLPHTILVKREARPGGRQPVEQAVESTPPPMGCPLAAFRRAAAPNHPACLLPAIVWLCLTQRPAPVTGAPSGGHAVHWAVPRHQHPGCEGPVESLPGKQEEGVEGMVAAGSPRDGGSRLHAVTTRGAAAGRSRKETSMLGVLQLLPLLPVGASSAAHVPCACLAGASSGAPALLHRLTCRSRSIHSYIRRMLSSPRY